MGDQGSDLVVKALPCRYEDYSVDSKNLLDGHGSQTVIPDSEGRVMGSQSKLLLRLAILMNSGFD